MKVWKDQGCRDVSHDPTVGCLAAAGSTPALCRMALCRDLRCRGIHQRPSRHALPDGMSPRRKSAAIRTHLACAWVNSPHQFPGNRNSCRGRQAERLRARGGCCQRGALTPPLPMDMWTGALGMPSGL